MLMIKKSLGKKVFAWTDVLGEASAAGQGLAPRLDLGALLQLLKHVDRPLYGEKFPSRPER
jgi:hypothetical protein